MGCSNSREANFGKTNLWIESENTSYDGSSTVKGLVLYPEKHQVQSMGLEESFNKDVNEDHILDQKKIGQRRHHEKIAHSVSEDLTAEGSLSEAFDLLEFSEISEQSNRSIVNLKDNIEGTRDLPIIFTPDITKNTNVNPLYLEIAKTKGKQNMNPSTYYAMTNSAFTYTSSAGRTLIGQRAQDEIWVLQRRRKCCHDNVKNAISGYTHGPYTSSGNSWHAENLSWGRNFLREYQSKNDTINSDCKRMETTTPKIFSEKFESNSTSNKDIVFEYGTSTETGSCKHRGKEDMQKISGPTEENSGYPGNKLSAELPTDSSEYLLRETLSNRKMMLAQFFLQAVQC